MTIIPNWIYNRGNKEESDNSPDDPELTEGSDDVSESETSPDNNDPESDTSLSSRELREFVYLDRDSVVSLLASIEGTIKQERVEQIGSQSEERVSGGVNASISGVGAKIGGERVDMGERSTEVIHNYAIQSLFDQLDQHRRTRDEVGVLPSEDDEVEVSKISRGDIIRLDVELETHYLYRFFKVMRYVEQNIPEAIGPEEEDVLDLIGSMFGTEVPVSGRALNHHVKDGKIHTVESEAADGDPLYIVGQLNATKLWQDVPDALFDGEEYTVFCRAEQVHEGGGWRPLSLAQKIETVSPSLAGVITHFMERASAIAKEEAGGIHSESLDDEKWNSHLEEYGEIAGVTGVNNDVRKGFLEEFETEYGVPDSAVKGDPGLLEFYTKYAEYLRTEGYSISKGSGAEATDSMIYNVHLSVDGSEEIEAVEGAQIETKVIAVYW